MSSSAQVVTVVETNPVVGIPLTAADTGKDGVQVVIASGECFGTEIRWFDESTVTATVGTDAATGLPMLSYRFQGGAHVHQMRGLEADGVTWWRYAHEVDPTEYREHCLRVVRKA